MRKLLSIGVLAAATLAPVIQPAIAQRTVIVHRGRWRRGNRVFVHRSWRGSYWHRGRLVPAHWMYW